PRGFRTRVVVSRSLTPSTHAIELEKPQAFSFRPTQFTFLQLKTEEGMDARPMSLATSPTRPHLEYAVRLSDSPYKRAFAALKPDDEVRVFGPIGDFVLYETRPAVLVAGGVGITPLKGMAEYAADKALPIPIRLVYSNRSEDEIVYRPELEALEIRRDDDLPVQRDVDGQDPGELADARNPSRDVPEIDSAAQQEPRGRFLQLVDEEDVAQGPAHVGHRDGPEYRRRIHQLSRVAEGPEPGRDEQELLPQQALEMFPHRLRAESRRLRQFLQRPPWVVDERVDDPPFERRHGAGFPSFGERLSGRLRAQAGRQLSDRPRAV